MILRRSFGLLAALALAACAAPSADTGRGFARGNGNGKGKSELGAAAGALDGGGLSPARYLFTDRLGVMFDEGGAPASLPRPEPAVIDGVRVLVDNGICLSTAPAVERLSGFRSLPARLGGGYVIWSESRVYRAASFLGELKPIADVGSSGGARPFLTTFLLRTEAGVLEVDPTSLAVRRAAPPGLAEALALDARRAARLDAFGRASFTVDGGATWTDVLETLGAPVSSLREGPLGELLLAVPNPSPSLRLGREGDLEKIRDPPRTATGMAEVHTSAPLLNAFPASSRSLPGEILAHAVVAGAFLPPAPRVAPAQTQAPSDLASPPPGQGSLLVARENGLRLLSVATALPIADADLLGVDEKFGRCQAFSWPDAGAPAGHGSGSPPVLALCAQDASGEVLDMSHGLSRPRLEITFPEAGTYVAGPRGRLGFTGRCGPLPPSGADLGPGTPRPQESPEEELPAGSTSAPAPASPPEEPSQPELPPADDARFCVRISADHWLERRLRGDDARHLYRWVPGDDGRVTALLLGHDGAAPKGAGRVGGRSVAGEGVRVIHLEPDDPALGGGAYPAVAAAQKEPPYRSVDADFWQDSDGAIRGWVSLPAEGETAPVEATAQGPASRLLRVQTRRGGRSAGIRIDGAGKVTRFALPEGTTEVVTGGRFGLAMAVANEEPATFFETTDGGRTWTPIEGPPVGRIEAPPDESAPFGCSPIGCTWASGMVRLGWGGPPPRPRPSAAEAPAFTPAANPLVRGPKPLQITCRLDTDAERGLVFAGPPGASAPPRPARPSPPSPGAPPLPITMQLSGSSPIGALRDHTWSGDVWLPFQPGAALRHLSATAASLTLTQGSVVPILDASPRAPVDLLLVVDKHRLRAGAPGRSFLPFDLQSKVSIAVDGPDGLLLSLDADKGVLWASRGDATSVVIRLTRVPDVSRTRLTLARRLDGPGVSLVGYSTSTGDVFAGEIDLARAEIRPLTALGRIDSIDMAERGTCQGIKATHRFLAEVPAALTILGKSARSLFDAEVMGTLLLSGNGQRLCASAWEVGLGRGNGTSLTASFSRGGGAAAVRSLGGGAQGSCSFAPGK